MASDEETQEFGDLEARLDEITLEDVASRHRRERKELQAKLQALKKNAPKNDKKKRKEFLEQMAHLEGELERRHKAELQAAEQVAATSQPATAAAAVDKPAESAYSSSEAGEAQAAQPAAQRVSKAQKRREKKEREASERERELRDELLNADKQPSAKRIELQKINAKLASRQLALHQMPSDGDCLYNAVRHQMLLRALPAYTVAELRRQTADYVRQHKDTLICYMTHPVTDELLNDEQFEQYCRDISDTHAWGGHIELKALSSLLSVCIEVLQAEGTPTLLGAEEFDNEPLVICYHRYIYQLGEHYNSTVPLVNGFDDNQV